MRVRSRTERQDVVRTSRTPARSGQMATPKVSGVFKTNLIEAEEELIRADLEALMEDVDRAGFELKRWRGRAQLEAYRRAVKAFLQVALERMYHVHHETRFDARGRRVKSVVIQAIDAHLEAVANEILKGEKSAIPLAARLDEIRGLLLDLYG